MKSSFCRIISFHTLLAFFFLFTGFIFAKIDESLDDKMNKKFKNHDMGKTTKEFDKSLQELKNEKLLRKKKASSKKRKYRIQSVTKGKVRGWFRQGKNEDTGAKEKISDLYSIDVKFKINHDKKEVNFPHFKVYVYDKNKNLVKVLEDYFIKSMTEVHAPREENIFKSKKTYTVQFDYNQKEVKFKYYLVVMGDDSEISVEITPKADIYDFDFEEKNLLDA